MSASRKKFDTTRQRCDLKTFLRVENIIREHRGEECVRLLEQAFESGVPANAYSEYPDGRRPNYLSVALSSGNQDAMAHLIRLSYQDLVLDTCHFHLYFRYPKALEALADRGHSFQDEMKEFSSLFWSFAESLGPEFFKTIARNGTNLDALIDAGDDLAPPVVRYATYAPDACMVEKLLAAGADPAARGKARTSALHGAVTEGKRVHLKRLDSVESASRFEKIVVAMLSAGGNIDMTDDEGRSALHVACKMGYFNKARLLLECGADRHLKDKGGNTPVDLAFAAKRRDVLQLFASIRARAAILDVVAKAAASQKHPSKS